MGGDEAIDRELERLARLEAVPLTGLAEGAGDFLKMVTKKKAELGTAYHQTVRRFLLQTIDFLWVEHLEAMEYLRSSVNLRAYGQRDPLVEYKKEGLQLFQGMESTYAGHVLQTLPNLGVSAQTGSTRPVNLEGGDVERAARLITAQQAPHGKKEYGRNDHVVISNGTETRKMKYKKAEPLLAGGEWRITGV